MKKIILIFFLLVLTLGYAQKVPTFALRSEVSSYTQFGLRGLNKNDLYVILGTSDPSPGSPSRYLMYIFKEKGDVSAYYKDGPLYSKTVELSQKDEERLFNIIQSKKFKKFLKYNQADFELKNKNKNYPVLLDTTYSLTVIQNGKQNSYSYLSKKYLESDHPRINKRLLKKYAAILDMFGEVKANKSTEFP
ncbi:hypothetical protein SAMN05421594_1643 [Chryseobacterium oleae]|uniref:Uncharacterized protein n=1 Tax=Chryseobacterium oleae TaxID=491207 RepID=A0A1I4XA74_CHROL|nr:hypothetical protein [Chryseobacterium oleae]SFN22794.1 hypothetical protein SAMN05421594_1643 [Chryseobacterium oleae]